MQYMKKPPVRRDALYRKKRSRTSSPSRRASVPPTSRRGGVPCERGNAGAVREAEILVTHVAPVNRAVLDAAPNVKIVGVWHRHGKMSSDLCRERGIAVYNAEGRNSTAVADLVVALMLCEMRTLLAPTAARVQGKWVKMFPNIMMNRDMCRRTVGIIGVGKIGTMSRRAAQGLSVAAFSAAIFSSPPEEIERPRAGIKGRAAAAV